MASFSMEVFVGDGALKEILPKLVEEGWDDVPTLKVMNSEDMDLTGMTRRQKDGLEIRSYLHDLNLMQYADTLEASGKSLDQLLNLSRLLLSTQFGMKRGHVARFIDRTSVDRVQMPPSTRAPPAARAGSIKSARKNTDSDEIVKFSVNTDSKHERSFEQSISDLDVKEGHVFKGVVASQPAEPRLCGCVQPPPVVGEVAPYSSIEKISIQKLTPEYKVRMERLVNAKAPPMKASDLWHDKPVILLCVRRPGCIMCRAEAHQLYSRKPIFEALGFQMIAVLHQRIECEVTEFWPHYWGGAVVLDPNMGFFKALGGGELMKDKFISGFVFNPRSIANFKRAKAAGLGGNLRGEGQIKGGLLVVGRGKSGIIYQFVERNFGDWAPISEVIQICRQLKNALQN